jgi:hypothetical protein
MGAVARKALRTNIKLYPQDVPGRFCLGMYGCFLIFTHTALLTGAFETGVTKRIQQLPEEQSISARNNL